jgi:flavin-dependent dehydrogenase
MMHEYDCVIIGAGPAGCAAATILAKEHGRRVAVLEKHRFPRYRVGESMIPFCNYPLKRMGMIEQMKQSRFVEKHSVQFISREGKQSQPFYFFDHMQCEEAQTWQVVRSEFDQMLVNNARDHGVDIFEEHEARTILRDDDGLVTGVEVRTPDGETQTFSAPVTVDASGRSCFSMVRNRWREADPELRKVAIWTYYKGAQRQEGIDEGATTVAYAPCGGWFWYIPLPDDTVSVGVVGDRDQLIHDVKDPGGAFDCQLAGTPWILEQLEGAERIKEVQMTADYSYRARHCAEDGMVLAGDAFAFLDPVFSTGLFLALRSGELVGDAVNAALDSGDCSAAAFADYGEELCRMIEALRKLVYVFYDSNFSFRDVLMKYPHLKGPLTDCLIGDVSGDLNELWTAIEEFAPVPEPLSHGRAVPA